MEIITAGKSKKRVFILKFFRFYTDRLKFRLRDYDELIWLDIRRE